MFLPVRFVVRRVGWHLTPLGWFSLLTIFLGLVTLWCLIGERFLCENTRTPADFLLVESWVGTEALQGAAAEFQQGRYSRLVLTGSTSEDVWSMRRSNFAEMAAHELISFGVSRERIIVSPVNSGARQRTFAAAVSAWKALDDAGLHPRSVNVFTFGAHGRRSRLVFSRTAPAGTSVGVVSWLSRDYADEPWWSSSEREDDFIKETVGYAFELFAHSGRWGSRQHDDVLAGPRKTSPLLP